MKPVELDDPALKAWPLPHPQKDGDKEARGRVLVIAGSTEMPGAAVLAAQAALRAGAGKLVVATAASVAPWVAQSLPEARVIGLQEGPEGGLRADRLDRLDMTMQQVAAVLAGPGMQPEAATCDFVAALVRRLQGPPLVLDAAAMGVVRDGGGPVVKLQGPTILTPHAGEMAHLTGERREDIERDPAHTAQTASVRWGAVVALKGAETWLAAPDGRLWRHTRGNVGLATSGSGDVLAGLVVGLLARGASPEQAAAWGVALHARAGERLAERIGPMGYLARELAAEVPALMASLA
jgi:hydroxyethylthiazole kinase-like uncharacterized protein yjeF